MVKIIITITSAAGLEAAGEHLTPNLPEYQAPLPSPLWRRPFQDGSEALGQCDGCRSGGRSGNIIDEKYKDLSV